MRARFAFGSGTVLLIFLFSTLARSQSVKALQIPETSGWVAKSNSISELSIHDFKKRLGLKLKVHPEMQFEVPEKQTPLVAGSIDWRNRAGMNWVSPILNQGHCGSCVAFAAVGVLETQYKIASGFSGMNVKFSPQFLFSCGGGSCDQGWTPDDASDFLKLRGVTDEACMPYTSGAAGSDIACHTACANAPDRSVHITDYSTPTTTVKDLNAIRKALAKGPLVTTLAVYEDFPLYSSGIYKHVTGESLGGHAVSIVGFDDATRSFIVRNSWGEDWGEKGYIRISYDDESGIGDSTWLYELPKPSTLSLESPRDRAYVSGDLPLQVSTQNIIGSIKNLEFTATVYDSTGSVYWSGPVAASSLVNVAQFKDGRYELEVANKDGSMKSQRRYFFVMNTTPQLALSFVGDQKSSPVVGTLNFTINGTSSGVPMNEIEVYYRTASQAPTIVKADFPASPLSMKWRTKQIKNGIYEVWMVGHAHSNHHDLSVETPHQTITVQN